MDITGNSVVSNQLDGVYIYSCTDNQIGGLTRRGKSYIRKWENGITIYNPSGGRNIINGISLGQTNPVLMQEEIAPMELGF
jgi:nitrous oxidase accessory protein NosD